MVFISFFFFKQKTSYEMRISDWSSDVCSSDLAGALVMPKRSSSSTSSEGSSGMGVLSAFGLGIRFGEDRCEAGLKAQRADGGEALGFVAVSAAVGNDGT